jgi:RNA polymerase sigma-70 factor (ECF subfamily)
MSLAVGLDLTGEAGNLPDASGLQAPLREIYTEFFPLAWRSLRRLGVPELELEDAAQDVFIVVYRRWSDFERRSSLKTWIYGIVLRVAKDYRRAEERHARRIRGLSEAASVQPLRDGAPDREAERAEARRLVHAALGGLRHDHREVLVLVELEQLTVREAAAALGLHVRACQRRLRASHHALEAALAAELGPSGRSPP